MSVFAREVKLISHANCQQTGFDHFAHRCSNGQGGATFPGISICAIGTALGTTTLPLNPRFIGSGKI
jgi:hypothetical protein